MQPAVADRDDPSRNNAAAHDYTASVRRYQQAFLDGDDAERQRRREQYHELVTNYYNLATDFYLWGWGRSFHFAPRRRGESLQQSLERFELRLVEGLSLRGGVQALDLGCGVGGPLLNLTRATGATITGVNNNAYQLTKAREFAHRAGLVDRCRFMQADFMHLPAGDETYDAAYSIEAVPHAPDKRALFREIFRVLRPGGSFAASDWCLTDAYNPCDPLHRRIRDDVELGNGLPALTTADEACADLEAAGFEIVAWYDAARDTDSDMPWYAPLAGQPRSLMSFLASPLGRRLMNRLMRVGEALRLVPRGAAAMQDFLTRGADALVVGGETGVFSPLVCWTVRKPQ